MSRVGWPTRVACTLVRWYRAGRVRRIPTCRYVPTCSQYMEEALVEHGLLRGLMLGLRRISRCHPWREGGIDPVPNRANTRPVERGRS